MSTQLEAMSAAEFVVLRRAIEDDYVAGRVVIRPDGWIVSRTEHELLAISRDEQPETTAPSAEN